MIYLHDIANQSDLGSDGAEYSSSDDDGMNGGDGTDFSSSSSSESEDELLENLSELRPSNHPASARHHSPSTTGNIHINPPENPSTAMAPDNTDAPPIPRNKSIAHFDLQNNTVVFCSLDLETGGEYCGIIQLSAELFRPNPSDPLSLDHMKVEEAFDMYVKPPPNAIWNEEACRSSHGLTASSTEVVNALPFVSVWAQFCAWIHRHVSPDEKCILCAYRGETCDLRWLWKHTQAPRSQLTIPSSIVYFMDPLEVIQSYKSCKLHPSKSKLDSLELGCVYKYITGENLNGMHNSLVDVRAQTEIITHPSFLSQIDRTKSIRLVCDIFSRAEQRDMTQRLEPLRPPHHPWVEIKAGDGFTHHIQRSDMYTGPEGGGNAGPSSAVLQLARNGSLSKLFLHMFSIDAMTMIADRTRAYAFEDWVVPTARYDRAGNVTARPIYSFVSPSTTRNATANLPSNARHRRIIPQGERHFDVTPYSVMAWIGIVVYAGAIFTGDINRGIDAIYCESAYGVSVPFVQNTMTKKAFYFLRNFMHFSVTQDRKRRGQRGYDPLFKVRPIIEAIMKGLQGTWIAGEKITIDESIIRYNGRAIMFVQYNPRKPIKHGIKVFAVCCAYSGVMLGFEVYCGSDTDEDNSALAVVDRLLQKNHLTTARGRAVYTDNWYTTVPLARHLYEKYGMFFCGTMTPTDKKARQDLDVPFLKLSRRAKDSVPRGWFREAVVTLKTSTGKTYRVQHTAWKDKKQVCFLHTNNIGGSSGHTVSRSTRGSRGQSTFPAPLAQRDYSQHFNAVDRNDRDSSDYTTSMRTNRWYMRIFFWLLDRVVHQTYVIVAYCADMGIGPDAWKRYLKKGGRKRFQIDMAREIMNYAIGESWSDFNNTNPPIWMRQFHPLPCDCTKCFFCIRSITTGIDHKKRKDVTTVFFHHDNKRTKTKGCTDVRVNLERGSSHCRQCYRERQGTRDEKMKGIPKSSLGCPSCDEPICKKCWERGYDMHMKTAAI